MRIVLLLPLFIATVLIGQVPVQDADSPLTVLEFRWVRDRKTARRALIEALFRPVQ